MKSILLCVGICLVSVISRGQNGYCLKYAGNSNGLVNDTLEVCYLNGDSYNQLVKVMDGRTTYRSLKLKSKPESGFNIFPDNTYRVIPDVQLKDYVIKVLGREKVNNYNCTKISISTFRDGKESTMWITDEIPAYKECAGVSIVDFKVERINNALSKQNLGGIPIKIAYNVQGNLTYELVKAAPCELNAGRFDLGSYTNAKSPTNDPK